MRRTASALLVVGALWIVGCRGDVAPRADTYVGKGDAICKDFVARAASIRRPGSATATGPYLDRLVSLRKAELSRLTALAANYSFDVATQRAVSEVFRSFQGRLALLKRAAAMAHAGNTSGALAEAKQAAQPSAGLRRSAQQLDWRSCAT